MKNQLLLISLLWLAFGCSKSKVDLQNVDKQLVSTQDVEKDVSLLSNNQYSFLRGADVSFLTEMEDKGRVFFNTTDQQDLFVILKERGINTIRLRVWVNPTSPNLYNGIADVVEKAVRAKNAGMKLLIDFHYSDSWADPKKQNIPAAWTSYTLAQLADAVRDHTTECLKELIANGVTPTYVQVGNETDYGMLWPVGQISAGNMANYALLHQAGYEAVKAVNSSIKVMVHFSRGYDNTNCEYVLDGLEANGADFDIIGLSVYPGLETFDAVLNNSNSNMQALVNKYNKDLMVAECGYYQYEPEAAREMVSRLLQDVSNLPNGRGLGVYYWEPEAYDHPPVNKSIFDANTKRPTVGMDGFSYLANPGFEVDTVVSTSPTGWITAGSNPDANYTENGGHTGSFRLSHYKNSAYNVSTSQTITGLTNGTYTFQAWVRGSAAATGHSLFVKDHGGAQMSTNIVPQSTWQKIRVSNIQVTNGQCTIGLQSLANNTYCSLDNVEFFKQ